MRAFIVPPALLLLLAPPLPAEDSVEVLTVRNRPAEDLVAAIEPLVGTDGSVASLDNRLIVRAAPEALRRIRAVVAELDVAPRSLWITVRQQTAESRAARSAGVSGSVPVGGGGVRVENDGVTLTTRRSRTVVTGSIGGADRDEAGQDLAHLRALEGRPAFIRLGTAVPTDVVAPVPGGVVSETMHVEADTGFWVAPFVSGGLVTLQVGVSKEAVGRRGTLEGREARTTLSGPLGEWIQVGGATGASASTASGVLSGSQATRTSSWNVELKVDVVPAP